MEPFRSLTASQSHALDRVRRLGELHFSGVAAQLPVHPRLWPLLVGPTGAGKSFLVRTAAAQLGAHYLPLSFGGWIAMGARQVATAYTILHAALDCPRLVVHLDELDKLPVGKVGDWAQAVANEVWALLDGQLPVARFANDPDLSAVLRGEERERLLREGVMHRLFLVGSGTWQTVFDDSVARPAVMGFGRQPDHATTPGNVAEAVVRALEDVRGPSSELLARFDGQMLFVSPPTQDEALGIVRRLGLLDSAAYAGAGEVGHVVAEVVLGVGEGLVGFVFARRHAEGRAADLGGEDGEVALLLHAALFPFIGEFIAHGDAAQALLDPVFGVAFLLVEFPHALGGEFGVFDPFQSLAADLGEPEFERLGLG